MKLTNGVTINLDDMRQLALAHMKEGVTKVINGEINEYNSSLVSLNDVISYIEEHHGLIESYRDTNGWQYDFWAYFNDEQFIVSGGGYYGGVSFEKGNG